MGRFRGGPGLYFTLCVACSSSTEAPAPGERPDGSVSAGGSSSGGASSSGGSSGSGGTSPGAGGSSTGGAVSPTDAGSGVHYETTFDLTESPISENGAWHHDGLDWTKVDTAGGNAFGTQLLGVNRSGATAYDDSYAYLSGFPANQEATAVVHLGAIDSGCTHEVEIILRWADSAHNARGYECNVAWDGSYAQIVRWNGAVGDYTYLDENGTVPGGIHDGDVVSASAIGDTITLTVNGTVRATAKDGTFTDGNPGIAFWRGMNGCGTTGDYGFTRYEARGVP